MSIKVKHWQVGVILLQSCIHSVVKFPKQATKVSDKSIIKTCESSQITENHSIWKNLSQFRTTCLQIFSPSFWFLSYLPLQRQFSRLLCLSNYLKEFICPFQTINTRVLPYGILSEHGQSEYSFGCLYTENRKPSADIQSCWDQGPNQSWSLQNCVILYI